MSSPDLPARLGTSAVVGASEALLKFRLFIMPVLLLVVPPNLGNLFALDKEYLITAKFNPLDKSRSGQSEGENVVAVC